jgi:enamine deaminase RidA (YjgF/YER057c/UK114 family)
MAAKMNSRDKTTLNPVRLAGRREPLMRILPLNPKGAPTPGGNYSQLVRVETGDTALLFISGQVAKNSEGEVVGRGSLREQAEQIFSNLTTILNFNAAGWSDVVRLGTYLVDGVHVDDFRAVRDEYLPSPPPASTLIFVPRLIAEHWLIEVDAVAAVLIGAKTPGEVSNAASGHELNLPPRVGSKRQDEQSD